MESAYNVPGIGEDGEDSLPPETRYRPISTQAVERLKYVVEKPLKPGCSETTTYTVYRNHISVESTVEDPSTNECVPGKLRETRIKVKQYNQVLKQFRRQIKECDPIEECEQCAGAGMYRVGLYTSFFGDMPSFSAWTDGCQCQHGQGGICGDGADFAGYLSKIETAERKKANRKKFTRKKVNQVDAIILTMGQGSFPCAERVNYYGKNFILLWRGIFSWYNTIIRCPSLDIH